MKIPFNRPHVTGRELGYIQQAIEMGHLSGDGSFTRKCNDLIQKMTRSPRALLVHSCTAALEMAALLARLGPGDEVILPSYTFVSTANAFVLRGARPVFVDIRPDTLNLDETKLESALSPATRAICVVHYAGVSCEMDAVLALATARDLTVIEDAAQGVGSTYKGRPLGSMGDYGALSFHETKNIISGEGGALLIRDEDQATRAEIIREKGTNRSSFFRGEVDKYTWVDVGSSYLPSEIIAAFLYAQLEDADTLNSTRIALWQRYHAAFAPLEEAEHLRRPVVPTGVEHNAHMYYVLLRDLRTRERVTAALRNAGYHAVFHYVPLHSSPAGKRFGRSAALSLPVTDDLAERLLRLPLWVGLPHDQQDQICEIVSRESH